MSKFRPWIVALATIAVISTGYFAVAADKAAEAPKAEVKAPAEAAKTAEAPAAPQPAADKAAANLKPDTVVAKVNGENITGADVLKMKEGLRPPANMMPLDMLYPAIVDRLIDARLVTTAATKAKLQNDPEVKERLKTAEERIVQDIYVNREVFKKVTDSDIAARYKKMSAEFKPETEVSARHILVATEAEAKDVAAKLKAGEDFAKLAREKSTDKASAANGGDLGFFTADQVVEPFAKAAFALKDGETSAPVQSQFGWHIIKAESRRSTKMPSLDDSKLEITQILQDEKLKDVLAGLRKDVKVEKFNIDGTPMASATPAPAATPPASTKTTQ